MPRNVGGNGYRRSKPPSKSGHWLLSPKSLDLSKLLPVGTICFSIAEDRGRELVLSTDDWCELPAQDLLEVFLSNPDSDLELLDDLCWLIDGFFVCARCRFVSPVSSLIIRIYLIPYDLPNVNGYLLSRPEGMLIQARKHMRRLLRRISKVECLWNAEMPNQTEEYLMPLVNVRQ